MLILKCKGCGLQLQTENPDLPGYIDKSVFETRLSQNKEILCKDCFRTKHYGEFKENAGNIHTVDYISKVVKDIDNIIFLIDLSDFFGTFDKRILNLVNGKRILYVANKVDLFPSQIFSREIKDWLSRELKTEKKNIYLISSKKNRGIEKIEKEINGGKYKKIAVVGVTSVGKSCFINSLLRNESTTVSRYPGTTMKPIVLQTKEGTKIVDTPGIYTKNRLSDLFDDKSKGHFLPEKKLVRTTVKCYRDMTVFFSAYIKMNFHGSKNPVPVFHFFSPENVGVHITNEEKSENKYIDWIPKILFPPYKNNNLNDIVFTEKKFFLNEGEELYISGLGFINMAFGQLEFSLKLPEDIFIKKTRAMIHKDKFK